LDDQAVEIAVYDMFGQKVQVLQTGEMKQGSYSATWNGRGNNGNELPIGVYQVVISGPSGQKTTKLMKSW